MTPDIHDCPKCATRFPQPLSRQEACPECGVYFFKLATPAAQTLAPMQMPEPRQRFSVATALSRLVRLLVLAGVALAGLLIYLHGQSPSPPDDPLPAAQGRVRSPVPASAPVVNEDSLKESVVAGPGVDPEILHLFQTPATVFDMREEVYRIANSNGITIESIHFHGDAMQLNTAGGDKVNAVAFAQPSLRGDQRLCDIRVVRPTADRSYQPGQPTNELSNLRRRTTIAHELSHCVDWYNGARGWARYSRALPAAPDELLPADGMRRWSEEVADVHAMILLKQTLGAESARLAAKIMVFERQRISSPWYRHAWVPLASDEPLSASGMQDAERIVAKYWGVGAL